MLLRCNPSIRAFSDVSALDFAGPVLLQQLLRAMEDSFAPRTRAVTFAALSLLVRLVACQSSVFSLWYSRRSYERSRGEMITMLYEKTLSRKIIGESALSDVPTRPDGDVSATTPDPDAVTSPQTPHRVAFEAFKKIGRKLARAIWKRPSPDCQRQPASVGKIYNLMR